MQRAVGKIINKPEEFHKLQINIPRRKCINQLRPTTQSIYTNECIYTNSTLAAHTIQKERDIFKQVCKKDLLSEEVDVKLFIPLYLRECVLDK